MKKFCLRLFALILAITMLATTFTGCRSGIDDEADDALEFVFVPDFTSLTALIGNLPYINNITLTENKIYFTTTDYIDITSFIRATRIFKVDLDESDITHLTRYNNLPNYSVAPPPYEAEGGGVYINAIQVDTDGNLWVAESDNYVTFDFPAGFDPDNADDIEIWEHHKPLEPSYRIRKLDSTGAELLSIGIDHLATANLGWAGLTSFYIDDEENIIIGTGNSIFVLDTSGIMLFNLTTETFVNPNNFVRLSDGSIAHISRSNAQAAVKVRTIDVRSKAWGASIDLPLNTHSIFNGYNEYLVVYNDGLNLMAIDRETNEPIQILNWVVSGIEAAWLDSIVFLPDERILLTTTSRGYDEAGQYTRNTELIVVNRTPHDEIQEKTVLTLASEMPYFINDAVIEFNRKNPMYRIEIIDIGLPGFMASFDEIDKFALEMMTGGGPDIIHTAYLPFHQWAGRGFFLDLYEFIDADPRLDRNDFLESVLRCLEISGRLYHISPDFIINTLIGSPDVIGSYPGWNLDEFRAVLEANPQATMPLGSHTNGWSFLQYFINVNVEHFVNWDTGTVYFDNDFFIGLLDIAYMLNDIVTLPELILTEDGYYMNTRQWYEDVISGEQILYNLQLSEFWMYSMYQDVFGGDFVFKGYPAESGSGNFMSTRSGMAITATSKNPQGAWEFISMFISEEWQSLQRLHHEFCIPTNRIIFEQNLSETMQPERTPSLGLGYLNIMSRPIKQEDTDKIRALVNSIVGETGYYSPLIGIIMESAEDFFNDMITAQDAARIIQNRVSRFVAEQSG